MLWGKPPTIGAFIRFINLGWNTVTKPKFFLHEDGYFLVKFESLEDRNEILYSGSFTLNNRPMIVKSWTPNFNFHDEIMRVVPLWVRFPNLLLNCWGPETLSRIGQWCRCPCLLMNVQQNK